MVVILDLGDGLDEEQQHAYDETLETLKHTVEDVWEPEQITGMPSGFLAWMKHDDGSPSPRQDAMFSLFVTTASRVALMESNDFRIIVSRHEGDPNDALLILNDARDEMDAVAVESMTIDNARIWGMVSRRQVLNAYGTPVTPEQIEAFLALDVQAEGAQLLHDDLTIYRQWADGDVYAVYVHDFASGQQEVLHGCYDTHPYDYLRTVASDLAGELSARCPR